MPRQVPKAVLCAAEGGLRVAINSGSPEMKQLFFSCQIAC